MIDFKEELKKYKYNEEGILDTDREVLISKALDNVQNIIKRFTKEQLTSNSQLEEILEILQETDTSKKENVRVIDECKTMENSNLLLMNSLIAVIDQMENIYRLARKNNKETYSQLQGIWKSLNNIISKTGIMMVDPEDGVFDASIHAVIAVQNNVDYLTGAILEVVETGYIYKGKLIRKAKVIVNKTGEANI